MDLLTLLILAAGGALTGSLVNACIYSLGWYSRRPISPWGPRDPAAPPRRLWDRIPVVGWLGLRRESAVHGRGFWIRPMLIELALAAGAVLFWKWQLAGGLVGGRAAVLPGDAQVWFATHSLLIVLLTIASFIDFDEQTIPDLITVPGTVFGLLFAAVWPAMHLPELVNSVSGMDWQNVHFASPHSAALLQWPWDWRGLAAGMAVIVVWAVALVPKIATLRWGWRRGLKWMLASMIRPKRRNPCAIRVSQRRAFTISWFLLLLAGALCLLAMAVFSGGAGSWTSLLSSLLGMAMGGGSVWAVRLVASRALGQEAMGFGDVTLMAMVGSYLGWQASLMVFALAPFAALLIAIIQFATSRHRALAFGPYLALAAVGVIIGWSRLWNDHARNSVFQMTGLLLGVLAASLVIMAAMLFGLRWIRGDAGPDAAGRDG